MAWQLVLVGVLTTAALASPQAPPAFEVASVKPQPWTGTGSVGIFVRGNSLDAEHISLFSLVTFAYNLRDVQLSGGPAWVKSGVLASSELFQVTAKAPEGTSPTRDVMRQMLQTLLAERFNLQVRHAEKELPTYNLVVKKGGPKLKESPADAKFNFVTTSIGKVGIRIAATHMTMQQLIDHQLAGYVDQPMFDKTGLTAPYDFTLEFAVQDLSGDNSSGLASLVTAVQEQLGLKLEPGRERFDTLVIEHAERPSEN